MTKIVYNSCYGGFSLSHEAIMRYAEIKGIKVWPKKYKPYSAFHFVTYWLHENPKDHKDLPYDEQILNDRAIPRTDPALVQVVEELGERANGRCAELSITELPPGTKYRLDKYDGNERVMTVEDYEWSIAE